MKKYLAGAVGLAFCLFLLTGCDILSFLNKEESGPMGDEAVSAQKDLLVGNWDVVDGGKILMLDDGFEGSVEVSSDGTLIADVVLDGDNIHWEANWVILGKTLLVFKPEGEFALRGEIEELTENRLVIYPNEEMCSFFLGSSYEEELEEEMGGLSKEEQKEYLEEELAFMILERA